MEKRKIFGLIIGILAFMALMAGLTLAWLNWSSSTKITGSSSCFNINYTGAGFENGSVKLTNTYSDTGTAMASVTMQLNTTECKGIDEGTGTLYLNTTSFNKADGTTTLLDSNSQLNYAVVVDDATSPVKTGVITAASDLAIYDNIQINSTSHTYKVYLWINGANADSSYLGASYSGYIHASAKQVVK